MACGLVTYPCVDCGTFLGAAVNSYPSRAPRSRGKNIALVTDFPPQWYSPPLVCKIHSTSTLDPKTRFAPSDTVVVFPTKTPLPCLE